jgi:Homeodomain
MQTEAFSRGILGVDRRVLVLTINSPSHPLRSMEPKQPSWMPPRPRRKRITPEQLDILTAAFDVGDTPTYDVREHIAAQTLMSNREVQGQCCLSVFL